MTKDSSCLTCDRRIDRNKMKRRETSLPMLETFRQNVDPSIACRFPPKLRYVLNRSYPIDINNQAMCMYQIPKACGGGYTTPWPDIIPTSEEIKQCFPEHVSAKPISHFIRGTDGKLYQGGGGYSKRERSTNKVTIASIRRPSSTRSFKVGTKQESSRNFQRVFEKTTYRGQRITKTEDVIFKGKVHSRPTTSWGPSVGFAKAVLKFKRLLKSRIKAQTHPEQLKESSSDLALLNININSKTFSNQGESLSVDPRVSENQCNDSSKPTPCLGIRQNTEKSEILPPLYKMPPICMEKRSANKTSLLNNKDRHASAGTTDDGSRILMPDRYRVSYDTSFERSILDNTNIVKQVSFLSNMGVNKNDTSSIKKSLDHLILKSTPPVPSNSFIVYDDFSDTETEGHCDVTESDSNI